jgi:hypothetical protein
MFAFTEEERARYRETCDLGTDAQGREILVGLTLEETAEVMERKRKFARGVRDHDRKRKKRFLDLMKKHEAARLQVLGAEIQRRNEKPTLQ